MASAKPAEINRSRLACDDPVPLAPKAPNALANPSTVPKMPNIGAAPTTNPKNETPRRRSRSITV